MKIVGCDLHTRYQQTAMLDRETGELIERRLEHERAELGSAWTAEGGGRYVGLDTSKLWKTLWMRRTVQATGADGGPGGRTLADLVASKAMFLSWLTPRVA